MKALFLPVLLLMLSFHGKGQSTKNQISYFLGPTYSKTNFNLTSNFLTGWFKQLYETKKPTKGVSGHYIGLDYRRKLSDKFEIGIGFNYSMNGQQSPNFFKIKGISEQALKDKPDYGGTSYRVVYKSYESALRLDYVLLRKNDLHFYSTLGAMLNVYYRVEANNFFISRSTGDKRVGANEDVYFHATGGRVEELKRHLKLGLWRIGILIGGGLEYNPIPIWSIRAEPILRIYSDLHDSSESNFIMDGKLFNIGCNLGMGINF